MQKKYFLLLLLFAAILPSCKDEYEKCDDDPQCEYFYCEVNGEKWEANCESASPIFGCDPIDVQYYRNTSGNIEFLSRNQSNNEGILLLVKKVKNISKFNLYSDNKIQSKIFIRESSDSCSIYIQDTTLENSFNVINIDSVNNIIKAEIDGTFINKCNDIKIIRNGKLKAQYRF